jgi:tetratricopeptide (TPR) repeat protein
MNFLSLFQMNTPTSANEFFASGFRFFKKKRYLDAKSEFERALVLDSSHRQSLICLGQVLQYQTNDRGAIALYERAVRAGAQDSELFFLLGCAYGCVDEFDKSGKAFERALQIDPKNEKARENLVILIAKRRWEKNVQSFIPQELLQANDPRSVGIGELVGRFLHDHEVWIVQQVTSPVRVLVAQIPITLAGAFQDAIDAGLSVDRFFSLVRAYLASVRDVTLEKKEAEAALKKSPIGSPQNETGVLIDFTERVSSTLQTARSAEISPSRWIEVWQEILPKFEATARRK